MYLLKDTSLIKTTTVLTGNGIYTTAVYKCATSQNIITNQSIRTIFANSVAIELLKVSFLNAEMVKLALLAKVWPTT